MQHESRAISCEPRGINDNVKMVNPGVYRTNWAAGGITHEIEINTTTSPVTISVAEPKLGCKWTGKASRPSSASDLQRFEKRHDVEFLGI